ncbi:MAG: glycoside hydrolase [Clostridium sp.]|nr:glycoside hydrolase [Clostridium sp.]
MRKLYSALQTLLFLLAAGSLNAQTTAYAVKYLPITSPDQIVSGQTYVLQDMHAERGGLCFENGTQIHINKPGSGNVGSRYVLTIRNGEDGTFRFQTESGKYIPAVNSNANFTLSETASDYVIEAYAGENSAQFNTPGIFQIRGNVEDGRFLNANPGILASWTSPHPFTIHEVKRVESSGTVSVTLNYRNIYTGQIKTTATLQLPQGIYPLQHEVEAGLPEGYTLGEKTDLPAATEGLAYTIDVVPPLSELRPQQGKYYHISSDNRLDGEDVAYYLCEQDGTLSLNNTLNADDKAYVWKCTAAGSTFRFRNGNGKYLAFRTLSAVPYDFTITAEDAITEGHMPLLANTAGKYLLVKNDGSGFSYSQRTSDKTYTDCTSDFLFAETPAVEIPGESEEEEAPTTPTVEQPVGLPLDGKTYYLYSDHYVNQTDTRFYFYDNNGTLSLSESKTNGAENYLWTCTVTDGGKYVLRNGSGRYFGFKALSETAYNFTIASSARMENGVTLYGDAASRYLVITSQKGFDQSSHPNYDKTTTQYSADFGFIEFVDESNKPAINITCSTDDADGIFCWNGMTVEGNGTFTLPTGGQISETTLTGRAGNSLYEFEGFFNGDEALGTSVEIATLTGPINLTARFSMNCFSTTYGDKWVRIVRASANSRALTLPTSESYANAHPYSKATDLSTQEQMWCLVGTADNFKLYNRQSGETLALALNGATASGTETLMKNTADATAWQLVTTDYNGTACYAICPAGNSALGLNPWGGDNPADIRLYAAGDQGCKWKFQEGGDAPLTLHINVSGTPYPTNTRVGQLALTFGKNSATISVTQESATSTYYVPAGTKVSLAKSGDSWRGYVLESFDLNGETGLPSIDKAIVGDDGLSIRVNYCVDESDHSQYLFYNNDADGAPYRIPAIATTHDKRLVAVSDKRWCGADIGNGRIDLVTRTSTDNGATWDAQRVIAKGTGNGTNFDCGFGDAALVADRESNTLLLLCVAGRVVFWNATRENPAPQARMYSYDGGLTWTEPEDITQMYYDLLPNMKGTFVGSGRIFQSRVTKVGNYYRLYAAVMTHPDRNHVLYSDDFGQTWAVLGGADVKPAPAGDEPKCEEMPNGDVILSSRKTGGRYFNVFSFTDREKAEGSWGTVVASNEAGDLAVGGNSTNGEIMSLSVIDNATDEPCEIMLQSIPTGSNRSRVGIFYRLMDKPTCTPLELAKNWHFGLLVTTRESAYSTMCLQPDGRIGFFYEETPGGYCMVYEPLDVEAITNGRYRINMTTEPDPGTGIHATEISRSGQYDVYSLSGVRVRRDAKSLDGLPKGIYIAGGQKRIVK